MDEPNSWSVGARIKNGGSGGMGIGGKQPMRQQNGDDIVIMWFFIITSTLLQVHGRNQPRWARRLNRDWRPESDKCCNHRVFPQRQVDPRSWYDSMSDLGEIRVYQRADFQSGSRVLKKVFWTLSYLYLWHTMWFHAKKLLRTLKFWKSLNSLCKSGSRPQKSPKKAQKTDHSIAIYSNFWIGMVYFGYHLVKAHVQTVQNMYGKGG